MVHYLLGSYPNVMMGIGALTAFMVTVIGLFLFRNELPADEGRAFAVEGTLSKGKPRGAGLIFIAAFAIAEVLFAPFKPEYLVYTALIIVEMLTGYFDDAAKKPWGRFKKGILDLVVAAIIAYTYVHYNGTDITIGLLGITFNMNRWVLYLLAIILVWASINVTNCTDGVDGLSGTLAVVTTLSFVFLDVYHISDHSSGYGNLGRFIYLVMFFLSALLAYLLFNAPPSLLLMGDAGSRAMGVFLAILALKSKMPFLFLVFAIVIVLDGGLGLFKITCIRVFKKNPFARLRTPIHDHVRKNIKTPWSNEQVDVRFAVVQSIISIGYTFFFLR